MKHHLSNENIIWIAWESHRRTLELCRYLGISSFILESSLPRFLKHPFFIAKTCFFLLREKPDVLIVQNPSIILTLLGCVFRRVMKFYYIVDAHNGGIIADSSIGKKFPALYRFWQKEADLTIVTNRFIAEMIRDNGGNSFVLPDKLPAYRSNCNTVTMEGKVNILCVSTFDADEPFLEIFDAAIKLPSDYIIYMTGDYGRIDKKLATKCPKQVRLTGYLSENDYWSLLKSVDLIMDLTNRENCLVCGAYEGLSQGKPLLLSNTTILKEYFNRGAMFTQNDSASIQKSIRRAIDNLDFLKHEVREGQTLLEKQWLTCGQKLVSLLIEKAQAKQIAK